MHTSTHRDPQSVAVGVPAARGHDQGGGRRLAAFGVVVLLLASVLSAVSVPTPAAAEPTNLAGWTLQADENYLVGSDIVHEYTGVGLADFVAPIRLDGDGLATSTQITYLLVGGGGAGGNRGGGGGAGGVVTDTVETYAAGGNLGLRFDVTVGAGGSGATVNDPTGIGGRSTSGQDSNLASETIDTASSTVATAVGGGHGGNDNDNRAGATGGSGGGGGHRRASPFTAAGAGTPGQGNPGGQGGNNSDGDSTTSPYPAGGGGGAGAPGEANVVGDTVAPARAGNGGDGIAFDITGQELWYGGGGGGHLVETNNKRTGVNKVGPSTGGQGGGGTGGFPCGSTPGLSNTGGGGGGGDPRTTAGTTGTDGVLAANCPSGSSAMPQDGGSGIVVLRMPTEGLVHVGIEVDIDAGPEDEAQVTVTLQDVYGAARSGVALGLGGAGVVTPTQPTTSDQGTATFMVATTEVGSFSVTDNNGTRIGVTPTVPGAPTITNVVPDLDQLAVEFDAAGDGGSPITRYEYQLDGTWRDVVPATATSFTVASLTEGTEYGLRVRAHNAEGRGPASRLWTATTLTTEAPPGPQPPTFRPPPLNPGQEPDGDPDADPDPSPDPGPVPDPAPTPDPGPAPGPAPSPDPAPDPIRNEDGNLPPPGGGSATVDGEPVDLTITPNGPGGVTVTGDGFDIEVLPLGGAGDGPALPPGEDAVADLTFSQGQAAQVRLRGFGPRSPVWLWLLSDPVSLGTFDTDDDGQLDATSSVVPADTTACLHTLHLQGELPSGAAVEVSLGVWIEAAPYPFVDVDGHSVHRRAVACLASTGITRGRTADEYAPALMITRGQVSTMFARWFDLELSPDDIEAAGLPADVVGTTHEAGIAAMYEAGAVQGYPDGLFWPDRAVTRGQFASMLVGLLDLEPIDNAAFSDIAGVHAGAIGALAERGTALGMGDGTYLPGDPIRRDQAASLIVREIINLR